MLELYKKWANKTQYVKMLKLIILNMLNMLKWVLFVRFYMVWTFFMNTFRWNNRIIQVPNSLLFLGKCRSMVLDPVIMQAAEILKKVLEAGKHLKNEFLIELSDFKFFSEIKAVWMTGSMILIAGLFWWFSRNALDLYHVNFIIILLFVAKATCHYYNLNVDTFWHLLLGLLNKVYLKCLLSKILSIIIAFCISSSK